MAAHLRLLSAAHSIPTPAPAPARAPTSLHRLRQRLPAPPPAARLRLLRPPRLEESPRLSSAARCRCAGSAVAEDGGEQAAAGIWEQVRDIVVFAGPALGLWICGPLMSLIDTMVIGQTSALQLAALGPSPLHSYPSPYGITPYRNMLVILFSGSLSIALNLPAQMRSGPYTFPCGEGRANRPMR